MNYSSSSSYGSQPGQSQPGWLTRTDTLPDTSRRKKLAGYLKAANEFRQTYQQTAATAWRDRNVEYDYGDGEEGHDSHSNGGHVHGAFQEAKGVVATNAQGDQHMILFPSYARRHVRRKPRRGGAQQPQGGTAAAAGTGRDWQRGSDDNMPGAAGGDADFWREEWAKYEDDHAVVDVDVRGWVFSPHRGPMNRKQKLFIGLARQLAGLPGAAAVTTSTAGTQGSNYTSTRERVEANPRGRDEDSVAREAERILRKGEEKADAAARGAYSEKPQDSDQDSLSDVRSRDNSPARRKASRQYSSPLAQVTNAGAVTASVAQDKPSIAPVQTRYSWSEPTDMTAAELKSANSHLMRRLRPFLANPIADSPISAFFYNDEDSQQRTIYTDANGHFTIRAPLEFVPTHVRVLASEDLSATEEVIVTEPRGVSLISDIDDTIKHSAISSGAREIFRNAFIRELGELTIDGVKKWYEDVAKLGVKFHYVSNSPWQLYPVLTAYFALAGLPPGSFHLKQYSGMLQGIFEPVAERKKGTLDRLARDFPERSFILVGDSGEADIEVYTDFVLENPGRVLGVFIRDVTTSPSKDFFTSSAPQSPKGSPSRRASSSVSPGMSPRLGPARGYSQHTTNSVGRGSTAADEQEEAELQAAIKASLRDLEESVSKAKPSAMGRDAEGRPADLPALPPRPASELSSGQAHRGSSMTGDLIDLNDDENESRTSMNLNHASSKSLHGLEELADHTKQARRTAPIPPRKPVSLQQNSTKPQVTPFATSNHDERKATKPSPPKPQRPSKSVKSPTQTSLESNQTQLDSGMSGGSTFASAISQTLNTAYNSLPEVKSHLPANPLVRSDSGASTRKRAVLPPPPAGSLTQSTTYKRGPPLPPPRLRDSSTNGSAAPQYGSSRTSEPYVTGSDGSAGGPPTPPRPTYATRSNIDRNGTLSRTATSNSIRSMYTSASDDGSFRGPSWDGQSQQLSRKEVMWQQRLTRCSRILRDKRVFLKIWRVGSDAEQDCIELVEEALRREKEDKGPRARG